MPMVGGWLGQRMMQFLVCRFLNTVRSCEFQESSSVFMSSRFFSGVILSPAPRVMLRRAPHPGGSGPLRRNGGQTFPGIVLLFVARGKRPAQVAHATRTAGLAWMKDIGRNSRLACAPEST